MIFQHFFPPTAPLVYCIDERGVIEEPYQTPDNLSRKKGFVIVVQQLYKWRYLPVAKVLFCDCQRFADMLRNNSASTQMQVMRSFWSATWLHLVDRIVADKPVSQAQRRSQCYCLNQNWGPGTSQYMSFHSRKTYLIYIGK